MEPSTTASGHWNEVKGIEEKGIQHLVDDNKQPLHPQLQRFRVKLRVGKRTECHGVFKSFEEAQTAHAAAKAEKDAAYNQRMAQQDVYKQAKEAKAAANKRKQAEILEMRSKLDPARKRARRGRGKGPRVSHQQVDP